jgi:hypothetical protein
MEWIPKIKGASPQQGGDILRYGYFWVFLVTDFLVFLAAGDFA